MHIGQQPVADVGLGKGRAEAEGNAREFKSAIGGQRGQGIGDIAVGFFGVAGGNVNASDVSLWTALNPGSNTFTAKYRVSSGTGTFLSRRIIVMPF